MSSEYFHGYHWKNGSACNYNEAGIDKSCWLENETGLYNKNDHNISVYLLQDNRHTNIFKIGISKLVYTRISSLNSDIRCVKLNHEFTLVKYFIVDSRMYAELIEKVLLQQFNKFRVYRRSLFSGATELFTGDRVEVIKVFNNAEMFSISNKVV